MTHKKTQNLKCSAKECGEFAIVLSEYCWEHTTDKEGYRTKLLRWASESKDFAGCNLKKVVLKKALLEKVDFSKADLSQADLTGTHFFDVRFEGSDLIGTNFCDCDLTHCNIKRADLTKANLLNARLWNSNLTGANLTESNLSNADFWDTKLFNIKLWHAVIKDARSLGKNNFSSGAKFFDNPRINEIGLLSAEESYRELKQYFISTGRYNDASWASFKEKTMERFVMKKKGDLNYFPSLLMNILCGYGEKPYRIVLSAALAIFLFAALYLSFGAIQYSISPDYSMRWTDYLYYSTITFTTVGYGDFIPRPHALFRFFAAMEAFSGVFLTGLFIFTLARKYSAR